MRMSKLPNTRATLHKLSNRPEADVDADALEAEMRAGLEGDVDDKGE
jgi:hypothetical protein